MHSRPPLQMFGRTPHAVVAKRRPADVSGMGVMGQDERIKMKWRKVRDVLKVGVGGTWYE